MASGLGALPMLMLLGGGTSATALILYLFLEHGGVEFLSDLFGDDDDEKETKSEVQNNSNVPSTPSQVTRTVDVAAEEVRQTGTVSKSTQALMEAEQKAQTSSAENTLKLREQEEKNRHEEEMMRLAKETGEAEAKAENDRDTTSAMTAAGGAALGAAGGAAIGSIIPGIGTLVGGGIGALVGGIAGFGSGQGWW